MRQILDYPNYSVTSDGKVISNQRVAGRSGKGISTKEKELAQMYNQRGYKMVNLIRDKKSKTRYVHRLVAQAFIPNPDNLPQVNHIDGNKENNDVANLEWVSAKENNHHALRTGLRTGQKGSANSQSKLQEEDAIKIIHLVMQGLSNIEIAEQFKLHDRYVSLIRGKKRWKHLWETMYQNEEVPYSCRKRTKAFNAERLSKAQLTEKLEASRVESSDSKREDS